MTKGRITPVILSGGAGTRLWPVSRPERPKQMQALLGTETMLQAAARRVCAPELFDPAVIVAGADQADAIEKQLASAGLRAARMILEPCGRNSAAAIALAAFEVPGDALLLAMPSDHLIADNQAWLGAVAAAAPLAREGWIVTFGIRPSRPETGFGYIRRGPGLGQAAFEAEAFVEKPDRDTAASFIAAGNYDWNGGIFLFRAGRFCEALAKHAPDIATGVADALGKARRANGRVFPDADAFAAIRSQSVDHAVMEHADRIAVVPVDMGWSDVGSWDALYELSEKDDDANSLAGDAVAIGASGSLLRSEGPLVVAIGVENLIVVATPEAVLILPRGESQRAREAAEIAGNRDKRAPA